jgi:hypothetical protein
MSLCFRTITTSIVRFCSTPPFFDRTITANSYDYLFRSYYYLWIVRSRVRFVQICPLSYDRQLIVRSVHLQGLSRVLACPQAQVQFETHQTALRTDLNEGCLQGASELELYSQSDRIKSLTGRVRGRLECRFVGLAFLMGPSRCQKLTRIVGEAITGLFQSCTYSTVMARSEDITCPTG